MSAPDLSSEAREELVESLTAWLRQWDAMGYVDDHRDPIRTLPEDLIDGWFAEQRRQAAAEVVTEVAEDVEPGIYAWKMPNGTLTDWSHDEDAEEIELRDWLRERAEAIGGGR